jgi:hypothetical protein
MITLETLTQKSDQEPVDPKVDKLLDGPPSDDYNKRQIQLMYEWQHRLRPEEALTRENFDKVGMDWVGDVDSSNSMSKSFREIKNHPDFTSHSRLQGKISNIEIDDVLYWVENHKLRD